MPANEQLVREFVALAAGKEGFVVSRSHLVLARLQETAKKCDAGRLQLLLCCVLGDLVLHELVLALPLLDEFETEVQQVGKADEIVLDPSRAVNDGSLVVNQRPLEVVLGPVDETQLSNERPITKQLSKLGAVDV